MSCSLARDQVMAAWGEDPIYSESVRCEKAGDIQHTIPSLFTSIKKRNDHSSREQKTEDKKAYASLDFDRIFDASKGPSRPLRNLTKIPEDRTRQSDETATSAGGREGY
jgi:hypothetical protein